MNSPFSKCGARSCRLPDLSRVWLWLAPLLFCLPQVRGQTNFVTLVTNGPASNRLNIVFLAEGYRTNQYVQFLTDATNAANILLTNQPFAEYRPSQNVFAIAVPSVDSGSDHPVSGTSSNTYFNSTFDPFADFIVSIPANSLGQGKVDALLDTYLPQTDLAVLLVNDPLAGGSDGGGVTAIVSRGAIYGGQFGILPHETGHVLAGLGDEYTDAYPGYPDTEEPNTTRETNRAAIKWTAWIDASTPLPTPPNHPETVVGLFEGAHYHATGWYRPKLNCRMNSAYHGAFCEVCSEALVLSMYRKFRPVDSFTPASTNLSVTSPQALTFTLSTLQPAGHTLDLQWLTNGTPVVGATNSTFTILPAALGNGTKTVSGRVIDPTLLVRTDLSNRLSQMLTWTLSVSLPQLNLSATRWLGGGRFAFHVAGVAPQGFSIQGSSNLVSWLSLSTNTLVNGQYDYTNTQGTNFPIRFFRAVTPL